MRRGIEIHVVVLDHAVQNEMSAMGQKPTFSHQLSANRKVANAAASPKSDGLVLELPGQEPAVGLGKLLDFENHAHAALDDRREHHFGAEEAQTWQLEWSFWLAVISPDIV